MDSKALFLLALTGFWLWSASEASAENPERRTQASQTPLPVKTLELFGNSYQTARMGILLDCSGSSQPFLLAALKEFSKDPAAMPLVLAMGCGVRPVQGVKIVPYGSMVPDKSRDRPGSRTTLGQLAAAEAKFKGVETYLATLKTRDNVWAIEGGDAVATGYGFEHLIHQNVDTIYWFSDLGDAMDPELMEKITTDLKQRGIRVIVHNISGKSTPSLPERMANVTGGSVVSKVPK